MNLITWVGKISRTSKHEDKLTSSQDFPWASLGYRGTLGLTNDMKLETATSLGCSVQSEDHKSAHKLYTKSEWR